MDVKLLIDAVMRQTTVLIAQLSTAAGIRAPLAHIADQVFLDLAAAIEEQGVRRKVAADMFGLALRTYQKKVQRLTSSLGERDRSLWEAVLDHLSERPMVSRREIVERFPRDPEGDLAAVLNDLVEQGLVLATGRGPGTRYRLPSEADRALIASGEREESLEALTWLSVYRQPSTASRLAAQLTVEEAAVKRALASLQADGRVLEKDGMFSAESCVVPVGAEAGWEAAVFDHFAAMSRAVAAKLRRGRPRSEQDDVVGGATLTFEVPKGSELEPEVLGMLARVRAQANELWQRSQELHERQPTAPEERIKVTFYFGQNVEEPSVDDKAEDKA